MTLHNTVKDAVLESQHGDLSMTLGVQLSQHVVG